MDGSLREHPTDGVALPVDLVTDHPRSRGTGHAGGRVAFDPPVTAGPAAESANALLAAFAVLLARYSGQDTIALRVAGGGALGPRGDGLLSVGPDVTLGELVRSVAAACPPGPASLVSHPAGVLALVPAPRGGRAELRYDEGLFERSTVERMVRQLCRVARGCAATPGLAASAFDLVDPAELAKTTGAFNATASPYPREATIHALFAEQARRTPDSVAVTADARELTYHELDVRSRRLAGRLRAGGLRHGEIAGILLPRGPRFVIAALAVLRAGGAYLPIDPDYPQARVALLVADSSAGALIAGPNAAVPPDFGGSVHRLAPAGLTGTDEPDPAANLDRVSGCGDDPAYVIYTSGTTGRPKGVLVSHRNVVRLVRGTGYVPFGPGMRVLATCSPVFDVATFEMWGPLLNGGSLHVVPADVILDSAALGRALVERRITTMWLTTPLFNRLVEQDAALFRPLRELLVGGDALSAVHVGRALAACPGLRLVNGYGPTENSTFSTTHEVTAADLDRIPIGRPIANSTAYVLDRHGRPCPVGVPGELYLGGDGVAIGYHGRPDLTAASFVPDPVTPGRRLYRSGDLARWRPDGVLEFFGRHDHQVKVRGYRVELGEVEHAMLEHPAVRQAVVVVRAAPAGGDKQLCGYLVADPVADAAEGTGWLRAHLSSRLPAHLVPAYLVRLAELPLNRSGKVDRHRLPEPEQARAGDTGPANATMPADATEEALLPLVEQALGLTGLGPIDDLRDLGADSLTATLLASAILGRFGVRLPVSTILADASVAGLARLVRRETARPATRTVRPGSPRSADHPVTAQQAQLYVEQSKNPAGVHYNVPVSVDLPAGTDPARLAAAVERLATRHDALRTEFLVRDRQLRQRERPAARPQVEVLTEPPGAGFVRPFNLDRAPLWRAAVHPAGDRVRLALDLHHCVTDGVSIAVLFEELDALYHGAPMPPPGPGYLEFAGAERDPERAAANARYWAGVFAAPPPAADLPLDDPRPPLRTVDGDIVEFDLGAARTAGLRRLARAHRATLFAVLAAAYSALLARLTRQPDVVVGTPVSGRTAPGFERTVGMFANTVCLRVDADPGRPFDAHLRRVATVAEAAFAHQEHPFRDLVAQVAPRRDYARTPLFDSLIALHSPRYLSTRFGGRRVPLRLDWNGQAPFDLNLQLYDMTETVRARWQFASRLLRRETVCRWRDLLTDLIDAALADPGTTLGELTGQRRATRARVPDLEFDL